MGLKKILTAQPPAELASLYRQQGNEWVLDLEDEGAPADDSATRLKEFRENNIRLAQERDALRRQLEETNAKVQPREQEARTLTERLAHLETAWKQSEQQRAQAESMARTERFRGDFNQLATKHKVRDDNAARVLFAMASQTFKEKDGSFVPLNEKGETIYNPKTTQPLALEEWIDSQRSGPYKDLFSQPQGGGGRGSAVAGGDAAGKIAMRRSETTAPTPEQFKAMQEGRVTVIDG